MRRSILLMVWLNCCSVPEFQYPPGPPLIHHFTVTPYSVSRGDKTVVSWSVSGATSVLLSGTDQGSIAVSTTGAHDLIVTEPLELELLATGEGGSARAVASVQLLENRVVQLISFDVNPTIVRPHEPVQIAWSTANALSVVIDSSIGQRLIETTDASGFLVVRPEHDQLFFIRVDGYPTPLTATRDLRVREDSPFIEVFRVTPAAISVHASAVLEWNIRGGDRFRVYERYDSQENILREGLVSDGYFSEPVPGALGTRTFQIQVYSETGTVSEQTTLTVLEEEVPEILSFVVSPLVGGPGTNAVATWVTRFADQVELSISQESWSSVEPSSGSRLLPVIQQTRSIDLVAINTVTQRIASERVSVEIDPDRPSIDASLHPAAASPGEPVLCSWTVERADLITLETDFGQLVMTTTVATGSVSVTPISSTTLVMTAENATGETIRHLPFSRGPQPTIEAFTVNSKEVRSNAFLRFRYRARDHLSGVITISGISVPIDGEEGEVPIRAPTVPVETEQIAQLMVSNMLFSATATLSIRLLPQANGTREVEPNDTESTRLGIYYPPFAVEGEGSGTDVDLYEVRVTSTQRISGSTVPLTGCDAGVALSFYEQREDLGLLGPRVVFDALNDCPTFDGASTPMLAQLRRPIFIAVSRPTGSSTTTHYRLALGTQNVVCGDGVLDLAEACDDGNLISSDGCSRECTIEGLHEQESNDFQSTATALAPDQIASGYLGHNDVDWYLFQLSSAQAGPVEIVLDAPESGSCQLDAVLSLAVPRIAVTQVVATDTTSGGSCPRIHGPAAVLEAGWYYIRVEPGTGAFLQPRGRYQLTVVTR